MLSKSLCYPFYSLESATKPRQPLPFVPRHGSHVQVCVFSQNTPVLSLATHDTKDAPSAEPTKQLKIITNDKTNPLAKSAYVFDTICEWLQRHRGSVRGRKKATYRSYKDTYKLSHAFRVKVS